MVVLLLVRRALARPVLARLGVACRSVRATLFRGFAGCVDPHIGRGPTYVYALPDGNDALRRGTLWTPVCGDWRAVAGCCYANWWLVSECFPFPGSIPRFPGTRLREAETELLKKLEKGYEAPL